MASINNIDKDYSAMKISYTNKDYTNILNELIEAVPTISQKWNTSDENDPGMIFLKLVAILGDMLFYNQDLQATEVYPNSVTERKNAATIYRLIGYKMRWYKSAIAKAVVVNTYTNSATIPRFCTFNNDQNTTPYCTFRQYEVASNTTNNGFETEIELIQGIPVTPVRVTNNPYPEVGKEWHTIYGYNYSVDDIVNNRIYLQYQNVDQDHIVLVDDNDEEWALRKNIYDTTAVGKFFEFGVDVNDQPYLELVDYYKNYNINKFKVFYIRSDGEEGKIYSDVITKATGDIWSRTGTGKDTAIYNVSGFINVSTQYASTDGYDPETPDEARKNSSYFINTLDTLITLTDFEKAVMREEGVANVRATDLTNDPGVKKTYWLGDINQDGYINEDDYALLDEYIKNERTLTKYQKQLADLTQTGGEPTEKDLACLRAFLDSKPTEQADGSYKTSVTDLEKIGYTGAQTASTTELLDGFTVKLYILRTEDYDQQDEEFDENYISMIKTDLQEYKILPLNIEVDLHSIKKYYWSLKGRYTTKEPLSKDELQNITLGINRLLRYKYSAEKMNFNSIVNYREIISDIMSVDSRILNVDLDPITYADEENKEVAKEVVTGKYTQIVNKLNNEEGVDNLHYTITLDNAPILPGSVAIRINDDQYVLKDDANGKIYNTDNILEKNGKIDYTKGTIDLMFVSADTIYDNFVVEYTKNEANIALYRNLSTTEFTFDPTSLKTANVNNVL